MLCFAKNIARCALCFSLSHHRHKSFFNLTHSASIKNCFPFSLSLGLATNVQFWTVTATSWWWRRCNAVTKPNMALRTNGAQIRSTANRESKVRWVDYWWSVLHLWNSSRTTFYEYKASNFAHKNIVGSKEPRIDYGKRVWDKFYFNMCDSFRHMFVCSALSQPTYPGLSCVVNSLALATTIWHWFVQPFHFVLLNKLNAHEPSNMECSIHSACLLHSHINTYSFGCWLHAILNTRISSHPHTHGYIC